jgi:hypothetical protein
MSLGKLLCSFYGSHTFVGDLSAWLRVKRVALPLRKAAARLGELPFDVCSNGRAVVRWLSGDGTG